MAKKTTTYDPGLGTRFPGGTKRIISDSGNFNIGREGQGFYLRDVFQHLVNTSWPRFLLIISLGFMVLNAMAASLYVWVGIEGLQGTTQGPFLHEFKQAFFFSIQTCATVGYGHMAPASDACNVIAALETLSGLLGLSVATGLFYGRFSRPRTSIIYSRNAIVAPYQDGLALEFKMVNRRSDVLMDVDARVMLMFAENTGTELRRGYYPLKLEISSVAFMPLTWTLVHPITEESPLFGLSPNELEAGLAEVIIQIRAFDETYNQTIYSRHSYISSEIIWGAKFLPSFAQGEDGRTIVFVDKINDLELVSQ
jgi:inward rectifier potassium channel